MRRRARGDRRRGDGRPDREDDRRANVGAEAPGGENEGERQPDSEERDRAAATAKAGARTRQPRPVPATISTPAAPPARCRSHRTGPQAPGSAQQRERRQRRAGDHVDRVGEDRQPEATPGPDSRRTAPGSAPPAAARRASPAAVRRPGSARAPPRPGAPAAVDDAEPNQRDPDPGSPAPRLARSPARAPRASQQAHPDHRPARAEIIASRSPSETTRRRRPSPPRESAAPTSAKESRPSRSRIVGASRSRARTRQAACCPRSGPRRTPPGDPDRQRRFFAGGGRSIAINRSLPCRPAETSLRQAAPKVGALRPRSPSRAARGSMPSKPRHDLRRSRFRPPVDDGPIRASRPIQRLTPPAAGAADRPSHRASRKPGSPA